MATNQTSMMGPNTAPTIAVPRFWNTNSRPPGWRRTAGTTRCQSGGAATATPSTAPSTEMAGVMTPSP